MKIDKDYQDLTLAAKRNGVSTKRLQNYFQFGRKKRPKVLTAVNMICDHYCKYPETCKNQEELVEEHCVGCTAIDDLIALVE